MSGTDRARAVALEYFQQAYEKQMSGELDQAIELYQRSIATWPTAEAHTFLGWTYSFQGRLDEAIEECHNAIAVDPDFGNPYNDIGAYLIQRGQYDEAIPWLQQAMEAKRYEARAYPHMNLGRVWEHKGKIQDALREYRKALEEAPRYGEAYRALKRLESRLN
jgi:Tfp pilus assembly protein PilF